MHFGKADPRCQQFFGEFAMTNLQQQKIASTCSFNPYGLTA
jgi:hypothetical protein